MSHYSDYVQERTDDLVIENGEGFVQYRYLDDGESVYIVDIYVAKHLRRGHIATHFADIVCDEARRRGFTTLVGSVRPTAKGSTESLKVLLAYGMKLASSGPDAIYFRKDL
jgi:hypothetical protein